jgi:hypothetical protein
MIIAMTVVLPAPVASLRTRHRFRVGFLIGIGKVREESLARLSRFRGDLRQPDGGFDGFDLTEERDGRC